MANPRLPEIGEFVRSKGTLVKIEEIPPPPQPPPQKDYIFEEITARCEMRFNGECINHIQTLNDFYGYENSVSSAIEEMKALADRKGIDPDSDLEIVVIRISEQIRMRPKDGENFYDKTFVAFDFLDWGCRRDLPDPIEKIVWSSKIKKENNHGSN